MRTSKKLFALSQAREKADVSLEVVTGFSPAQIPGLHLWLDGSDASTLFQDVAGTTPALVSDPVGYWGDKSGNGGHVTQSTAGDRPTAAANGLAFDGSSDYLDLPNIDVSGWAGIEIFIAFTRTALSGQEGLMGDGVLFSNAALAYLRNTPPGYGFSQGPGAGNILGGLPAGQLDPIILRAYWDGATRGVEVDGISIASAASAVAVAWTANVRIGHVGALAAPRFFGGSFHEVAIYDRGLSASDAQDVTDYLMGKWN